MLSSPGADMGQGLVGKGLSRQALSFVNFRLLASIGESTDAVLTRGGPGPGTWRRGSVGTEAGPLFCQL